MTAKGNHLSELNRCRQINRRIRLVKTRMRDMPTESSYAEGRLAKLPPRVSRPPDWALAASRLATVAILKPLAHLKPKEGRKYGVGDLCEMIGVLEAVVSFVHHPTAGEREMVREVPVIAELKKPLLKQTSKIITKFFNSLKRRSKGTVEIPTWEQVVEFQRRRLKGQSEFATPDGELVGFQATSAQLYFVIWMFWPDLVGKFTTPGIHDWFRSELGERTSDKTVEAVVTRIRKEAKKPRATLIRSAAQ
jgi:hypothetical protein